MKTSLLLLLSLLGASSAIADQTLTYPAKNPLVSLVAPDDWEVDQKEDGRLFIISPDGGDVIVELSPMEAEMDDTEGALKEAKSTVDQDFKKLKLEATGPVDNNGLSIIMYGGEGEDDTGPAHINMAVLRNPAGKAPILFAMIVSKEAAGKYGAACGAILESISAASAKGAGKAMAAEGKTQLYAYPSEDDAKFTMEVPAAWALEADEKGAFITSADKKFTLEVIPVDVEHIEVAMEDFTKTVSAKFDEVTWNEGKEPQVNIDDATGTTLISSEAVAKGGGLDHKLGIYQFAKKGCEKFFILKAWSPLALADGPNGEAALKMLMSVKLT
jgi:hypothetical protein